MKKTFAYLVAALAMVFALCGCGRDTMDDGMMMNPAPTAMPSASPFVSPDMDDGIVKDKDGIINDWDNGKSGGSITESPKTSAMPKASTAPENGK